MLYELIQTNPKDFLILTIVTCVILTEIIYIIFVSFDKKQKSMSWGKYSISEKVLAFILSCVGIFFIYITFTFWKEILIGALITIGIILFFWINYWIAKGLAIEETDEEYKERTGYKFANGETVRVKKTGKIVTIKHHYPDDEDSKRTTGVDCGDEDYYESELAPIKPKPKKK